MSEKGADAKRSTMIKIFLVSMCALFMIHGCKKASECRWKVASTEPVTLRLMNEEMEYDFDIREHEIEGMLIEYVSQKANENVFQYFKNYCDSKGFVFDNKTVAFVFIMICILVNL